MVKFVQMYGIDVHEYLASEGENLMSLVMAKDDDKKKFCEFREKLKETLSLRNKQFVHGDLRPQNIIRCQDKFMVVDFDWTGLSGAANSKVSCQH